MPAAAVSLGNLASVLNSDNQTALHGAEAPQLRQEAHIASGGKPPHRRLVGFAGFAAILLLSSVTGALAQCADANCGHLTVKLSVDAHEPPGLFNVKIDGSVMATNVGGGGSIVSQPLPAGRHVIGENAGSKTDLTQFITLIGGDCGPDGSVDLHVGDSKTCTVLNLADPDPIVPTDQRGYATFLAEAKTDGLGDVSKDGSATYEIPLWVPPGRAGIQPHLSLAYDSRVGNGLLGVGWSLTGLSQITRCRRTFAEDGNAEAITFIDGDDGDRYCLDGQRLVKVGGPAGAASAYGSDGTEYRTENDIHAKIVSYGPDAYGPTYFRVYLKDGRILTLGGSSDSVLEGQRVKTTEANQATIVSQPDNVLITPAYSADYSQHVRYAWSLSRVEDRSGNFLTIQYVAETDNYGYAIRPTRIDYTGWAGSSTLAPKRHVELSYEPRPDSQERFINGLKLVQTRRLNSLSMSWGDMPAQNAPSASHGTTQGLIYVRRYLLTYHNGDSITGRSLLSQIQECDGRDVCKQPTVLHWSAGDLTFSDLDTQVTVPSCGGSPYYSCTIFPYVNVGDFNGDGKDDFIIHPSGDDFTSGGCLSIGSGCDPNLKPSSRQRSVPAAHLGHTSSSTSGPPTGPPLPGLQERVIDVNRDGADDILMVGNIDLPISVGPYNPPPPPPVYATGIELSTGPSFTFTGVSTETSVYRSLPRTDYWLDLNGDGLPDALALPGLVDDLALLAVGVPAASNASGWSFRLTPPVPRPAPGVVPMLAGKFNASMSGSPNDAVSGWTFAGPYDAALPVELGQPPANPLRGMYFGIDLHGSGKASMLGPGGAISYSGGTLISEPFSTYFGESLTVQNSDSTDVNPNGYCDPVFADINGDGLLDWVSISRTGGINVAINTGNGFAEPFTYAVPDLFNRGSSSPSLTCDTHNDIGLRVIDLNQDGRQDLVLMGGYPSYDGKQELLVLVSTGNGFTPVLLPIVAGAFSYQVPNPGNGSSVTWGPNWGFSQVLDFNGDGLEDLLQAVNGTFHIYVRQGMKADLLTDIVDGFGTSEHFDYAPVSNQSVYQPSTTCSYPQFCANRGLWVVSSHKVSAAGSGVVQSRSYRYQDGRFDLSGRGWVGFATLTSTDAARNSATTSTYDITTRVGSAYPCAHIPTSSVTDVDSGSHRVQISTTCRTVNGLGGATYFAYADSWDRKEWEKSVLLSEATGHSTEDLYGNTLGYDTAIYHVDNGQPVGRPEEIETTNSYDNFHSTWLIGQLRRTKTTAVTRSGATVSTKHAYEYEPGTGLLVKTIREPEERDRVSKDYSDYYLETSIDRNLYGLPESVSRIGSGQTRKQRFRYDDSEAIFIQSITDALGHSRQFSHYDPLGLVTQAVDENGLATKFRYDGFGRLRFIQNADSTCVELHYVADFAGEPESTVQNVFGGVAATVFDSDRREIKHELIRSGKWVSREIGYDNLGRLISTALPHWISDSPALTTVAYDDQDRLEYVQHPYPVVKFFRYDGLRTTIQDENHNFSFYTVDEAGRIATSGITGLKDVATIFSHTPDGLLDHITDYFGRVTSLEYDKLGRRTVLRDLDTGVSITHYNAFDDVKDELDGAGRRTVYSYDLVGRPTNILTSDGLTSFIWDKAANGIGKLASATSPDGIAIVYSYDFLSRPKQVSSTIDGHQYSFEYGYDHLGRLATITYPEAGKRPRPTVALNYEQNHRRVHSISDSSHRTIYWTAGALNARGQLTSEAFGNGLVTAFRYYDGDLTGWLSTLNTMKSTTPLQCFSYKFDGVGNTWERDSANGAECSGDPVAEASTVDGFYRIKTWNAPDWSSTEAMFDYDEVGNIQSQSGPPDSQPLQYQYSGASTGVHAVTKITSGSNEWMYTYDLAGNQVVAPDRKVKYTAFNLPARIQMERHDIAFQYDAFHQRAVKRDKGRANTRYVGGLFEERTTHHWWGANREYVFYLPGSRGIFGEILRKGSSDQLFYFHPDLLGSVTAVSDEHGNVVQRYAYSPFGVRKTITSNDDRPDMRLGFTGAEQDSETGLINLVGRIYDPQIARFLSADPYVFNPYWGQAYNRYSYVANNPLSFSDPTGFQEASGADSTEGDPTQGVIPAPSDDPVNYSAPSRHPAYPISCCADSPPTGPDQSAPPTSSGQAQPSGITGSANGPVADDGGTHPHARGAGDCVSDCNSRPQNMGEFLRRPIEQQFEMLKQAGIRGGRGAESINNQPRPPTAQEALEEQNIELQKQAIWGVFNAVITPAAIAGVTPPLSRPPPRSAPVPPRQGPNPGNAIPTSTPVGRSGNPMIVARPGLPPTNPPGTINGVVYTGHALDQMQGRGITPSVVENTLKTGVSAPGNYSDTTIVYDVINNISVVQNSDTGAIITVRAGPP